MTVNINGLSSSSKRSSLSDCVKSKIQLYACLQEMNSKKEKKRKQKEVGQIFIKYPKQAKGKQQLATFHSRIQGKKHFMRQRLSYIDKRLILQ